MAIPGSGFFLPFFRDRYDASQMANDWDTETDWKFALFNDTATPVFATDTAFNVAGLTNTNEVSGGAGWAAGGVAPVAGNVVDIASRAESVVFDAVDIAATPTDLTVAMALLAYDDLNATVADAAFWLTDFGTSVTTVNGQLDITWATPANGGCAYIDLVP